MEGWRKDYLKGLERTGAESSQRAGIVPVPTSQSEKPDSSQGVRQTTQTGLNLVVGKINPRLNTASV